MENNSIFTGTMADMTYKDIEKAKEVTPLGYCGDPSNINIEEAESFIKGFSEITAKLIYSTI